MMAALAAGSAGCATSGAVPRPFPGASIPAPQDTLAGNTEAPTVAPPAVDAQNPATPAATIDGNAGKNAESTIPELRANGRKVAEFALGFRGVPYRLGGTDPTGFDCSGLVQYVFAQYGITVPRIVEEQYEIGDKIDASDIKPGDLLFFNTKRSGNGASHVGIAIGVDNFVHAPNSAGVVRIETLNSSYWGTRYLGARRITSSTASN
jgi:cell wall-associated NlpC family hydrolase